MLDGDMQQQPPGSAGVKKEEPYWAAKDAQDLVGELQGQERNWWSAGNRRGYWQLLRLMYAQSQGMDPAGAVNQTQQLQFVGRNAKFVRFRVQLARSHIKQRNILAQGERPSFQCLALNDDFESMAQVPICQSGIDYTYRRARGEECEWKALESDGYFGEGFVWGRWDYSAGDTVMRTVDEPVMDERGEPLLWPLEEGEVEPEPVTKPVEQKQKAGAPTLTHLFPWDVVRDPIARKCPWVMVREVISKHEVAAKYKSKAEKIRGVNNLRNEAGIAEMYAYDMGAVNTDQIIVRHFYHECCDALPEGRYVGIAGDEVLWDEPNPIPEGNPIISICTAKYFGTMFGYPECSDLLAMQEMIDEILTQGANNLLRFGNQSLWAEDGVEVDLKALARGGGFFHYKTGQKPPQTIQWADFPPAAQYMLEFLLERMNEISGMNSVARGNPEANISSGAFAALLLNIAQKFVSATEQTLEQGRNDCGNLLLTFLRANSDTEFTAIVAGENQKPYLHTFQGTDFSGIQRVMVSTSSPLMRTIPGRFEVFNAIKDITDKRDRAAAYQLLTTGNSSAYTDQDMSTTLLIQWENQQLLNGHEIEPSSNDDPVLHNESHNAQMNKLRTLPPTNDEKEIERRQRAIQACSAHMGKHALVWAMSDPIMNDTLRLPRCAMPANPFGTLPVQGMPHVGDPTGAPQTPGSMQNPDGGLPKPAKPAEQPENAPALEPAAMAPAS